MKRTFFEQNQQELDFLAQIGDREMTPNEVKELQRIKRNARQYQWQKQKQDRIGLFFPKGYRAKLDTIMQEQDTDMTTFFRLAVDHVWQNSASYKMILELYNFLDLSSDTIDEDLASEKLKLTKVRGYSAWVYENKAGIYIDSGFIIPESEIKALD